jgi:hypothetical protein
MGANPESSHIDFHLFLDSGSPPVIGPRFARTRWRRPE